MKYACNRSPIVAATKVAALFLLMPAWTAPWPRSSRDGGSPATKADVEVSPAAAQALEEKMRLLATPVPNTAKSLGPVIITETEANSYLKYRGQSFLPPAVHDPEVHITSDRVSGAAEVDFDQLNQQAAKADDWATRAMTSIFSGRQRVNATGKLETRSGQGKVTIESASIGNNAVPQALLDWLVRNYLQQRYKIDLSKPFTLPDHVTRIELGAGRALFLRSPDKGRP
ncbi:MAG: hypothetical protein DMG26_03315 [Acidobacteria bacterium]|nr:MAG: hypothetical protein DMG26_03315 [Acidobacteriota bacterium]